MSNRPIFVTIIGGLNFLVGVILLLVAIGVFVMANTDLHSLGLDAKTIADIEKALAEANISWGTAMNISGVIFAIGAVVNMIIGYGLLKGWRIMWYAGVVVNILTLVAMIILVIDMISTGSVGFTLGDFILIAINIVILWYLFSKKVKEFFLEK